MCEGESERKGEEEESSLRGRDEANGGRMWRRSVDSGDSLAAHDVLSSAAETGV